MMQVIRLRTNHLENPLGFTIERPVFSFLAAQTQARRQQAARVEVAADEAFRQIVFDSGWDAGLDSLCYSPDIALQPRTRYFWRASVWADDGKTAVSAPAWFETAKEPGEWKARWITHNGPPGRPAVFTRNFALQGRPARARAYMAGLGVYEFTLNGQKVGSEYLAPGFHAYDQWIQYQTYDITPLLAEENCAEATVGDGWYCGRFGFHGQKETYGSENALIAELIIDYADGGSQVVRTDASWNCRACGITFSNIYDGEWFDASLPVPSPEPVRLSRMGTEKLVARLSPPITAHERVTPVRVIQTPAGETVLDMGQNMVGFLQATFDEPAGSRVLLQFGEALQDGCFYNGNLRTALQEYRFISGGERRTVRQHFTYYGFRYVKVSGLGAPARAEDFLGVVIHSEMERIGNIETGDPLVNRLFLNALWSQKGNFLDVPTDCPQRDERMGWTGDAQAFSGAASFNMDTYAFYRKYCHDLALEQKALGGAVPHVVPMAGMREAGSAAWGDAAVIIPWNVYLHTGDPSILRLQFDSMRGWVDYIRRRDDEAGGKRLWATGFHYGDWLALDHYEDPASCMGGTDRYFIASAYYCYSARLVSKAAAVLGREREAAEYEELSRQVRAAIAREYFTPGGRIAVDTQTACAVALFMDLAPEESRARVAGRLAEKLAQNGGRLTTGFVGTTYLCRALSACGMDDMAYRLLLNRDYPGWLYEILLGSTTIWERWNSLAPDGRVSGDDMNSLNHYAYGSIVEWLYRDAAGINPVEEAPGFRRALLAPRPHYLLGRARAELRSPVGRYVSAWEIKGGRLSMSFCIPFNAGASIRLPDARAEKVEVNGVPLPESGMQAQQEGSCVYVEAPAGEYAFAYDPLRPYSRVFDLS